MQHAGTVGRAEHIDIPERVRRRQGRREGQGRRRAGVRVAKDVIDTGGRRKGIEPRDRLAESVQLEAPVGIASLSEGELHVRKGVIGSDLDLPVGCLSAHPRIARRVDDDGPRIRLIEDAVRSEVDLAVVDHRAGTPREERAGAGAAGRRHRATDREGRAGRGIDLHETGSRSHDVAVPRVVAGSIEQRGAQVSRRVRVQRQGLSCGNRDAVADVKGSALPSGCSSDIDGDRIAGAEARAVLHPERASIHRDRSREGIRCRQHQHAATSLREPATGGALADDRVHVHRATGHVENVVRRVGERDIEGAPGAAAPRSGVVDVQRAARAFIAQHGVRHPVHRAAVERHGVVRGRGTVADGQVRRPRGEDLQRLNGDVVCRTDGSRAGGTELRDVRRPRQHATGPVPGCLP